MDLSLSESPHLKKYSHNKKLPLFLFYRTPPLTKFILALLLHTWNGTLKPFSSAFIHNQMKNIASFSTVSPWNSRLLKLHLFLWRQIHHVTAAHNTIHLCPSILPLSQYQCCRRKPNPRVILLPYISYPFKQINCKRELLKFCTWNDIGRIGHLPLFVGSIGRFSQFIETICISPEEKSDFSINNIET